MRAKTVLCASVAVAVWSLDHAAAETRYWDVETYGYYSSGDYGADEKTELIYWPLIVKHGSRSWRAVVIVPYLQVKSPDAQAVVDGGVERIDEESSRETRSGLGDIVLKGTWHFKDQRDLWPWMNAFVRVKLPTADEDKGLGTGETDVGFGLETVRIFPNRFLAFFDIGYTFIGEPSGVSYNDPLSVSIGAGYQTLNHVLVAAFYEWREAISPYNEDPQYLSFLATYRVQRDVRVFTMLDLGLNDGAADYGVAAGLSHRL